MKQECNISIQLQLDNITTVTYITRWARPTCYLTIQLWEWSQEWNIFVGRTPTRQGEHDSGQGVQNCERQMQLYAKIWGVPTLSMPGQPIHFPTDWTEILQLEARPGSGEDICLQPGLVGHQGLCQSPWCLISCCLSQIKWQNARVIVITPLWNIVISLSLCSQLHWEWWRITVTFSQPRAWFFC